MEYPMATLITGHRSLKSLVGVSVHEAMHSWYQGLLATNEALFPWMDEGFTCYASNRIEKELFTEDIATVPDGLAFDKNENLFISCYEPSRIYMVGKFGKYLKTLSKCIVHFGFAQFDTEYPSAPQAKSKGCFHN